MCVCVTQVELCFKEACHVWFPSTGATLSNTPVFVSYASAVQKRKGQGDHLKLQGHYRELTFGLAALGMPRDGHFS